MVLPFYHQRNQRLKRWWLGPRLVERLFSWLAVFVVVADKNKRKRLCVVLLTNCTSHFAGCSLNGTVGSGRLLARRFGGDDGRGARGDGRVIFR